MAKILVVDDDDHVRDSVCTVLEVDGHQVVPFENGRRAMETLQRDQDFDVVITDLFMPVMDGIELIREIVKFDRSMKIVAVSGLSAAVPPNFLDSIRHLGVAATLRKPCSGDQIVSTVRELVARQDHR